MRLTADAAARRRRRPDRHPGGGRRHRRGRARCATRPSSTGCGRWPPGRGGSPRCAPARSCWPRPGCSTATGRPPTGRPCARLAARYPEVEVDPDRIHVHDRDRWTSAGVTAGIDLALALVEDDHGPELAHAVAGWLVVFVRRPGGQAQFSAQLAARAGPSRPDRRAPALAARPPRRGPLRRPCSPAGRHEPAQLRPPLPGRDRHDARRLRRGAPGRGGPPPARDVRPHRRRRRRRHRLRPPRDPPPRLRPPRRHHPRRYRQHFARQLVDGSDRDRRHHAARHRPLRRLHRPRRHRALPGVRATSPASRSCSAPTAPGSIHDDVDRLHVAGRRHLRRRARARHPPRRRGGFVTRRLAAERAPIVDWIEAAHPTTTWTTSVCTGALLLGAAGCSTGEPATTHWCAYDELAGYGAAVTEQRVVRTGQDRHRRRRVGRHRHGAHARRPDGRAPTSPRRSSSASSTTRSRPTTPAPRRRPAPRSRTWSTPSSPRPKPQI